MKFGIFLPFHWFDRNAPAKKLYDNMLELASTADELGYDTVWIAEHHLIDFIGCPSPFVFASQIAQQTKKIRIGTAVAVLPFYHPLRFIGDAAVCDVVTGGRLEVGIGRGAFPYEFDQYQLDVNSSKDAFQEGVDVLLRMWRGEHAVTHKGKYWAFDDAKVVPDPLQKPHPPIWIGGQTGPTVNWAVKQKLNAFSSPWRDKFSRVEELYGYHASARAEHGVSREESRYCISRMGFVGETEADVRRQLPRIRFNHEMLLHLHNGTAVVTDGHVTNPPLIDPKTGEKLVEGDRFGWKGATTAYSDEDTYQNLILGTPDRVRSIIQQYYDLGLDELMLYMAFGAPQDEVLNSIRLFATEVMPHFRTEKAAVGTR